MALIFWKDTSDDDKICNEYTADELFEIKES